jgi:hypothetical protein
MEKRIQKKIDENETHTHTLRNYPYEKAQVTTELSLMHNILHSVTKWITEQELHYCMGG